RVRRSDGGGMPRAAIVQFFVETTDQRELSTTVPRRPARDTSSCSRPQRSRAHACTACAVRWCRIDRGVAPRTSVALQATDCVPTLTMDVFEQPLRSVPTVELDVDHPALRQQRFRGTCCESAAAARGDDGG